MSARLRLRGPGNEVEAARLVFIRALAAFLRRRGGSAESSEIVGGLGWFWLRLSRDEVDEVLEVAQEQHVEVTGRDHRQTGEPIEGDEWRLTAEGRKLDRTRGLSPKDLGLGFAGLVSPATDAGEKWTKRLGTLVLGAGFGTAGTWLGVQPWLIWIILGIVGVLVFRSALRGERALAATARRWKRLAVCRPRLHEWQTTSWHPWPPPVDAFLWLWALGLATALGLFGSWNLGDTKPLINWSQSNWTIVAFGALSVIYLMLRGRMWVRYVRRRLAVHREVKLVKDLRKAGDAEARRCAFGHDCPGDHPPGEPLYGPDTNASARAPASIGGVAPR